MDTHAIALTCFDTLRMACEGQLSHAISAFFESSVDTLDPVQKTANVNCLKCKATDTLPSSANQCILGNVSVRSNLSRLVRIDGDCTRPV